MTATRNGGKDYDYVLAYAARFTFAGVGELPDFLLAVFASGTAACFGKGLEEILQSFLWTLIGLLLKRNELGPYDGQN